MLFLAVRHILVRKMQSLVTLLGIFIGTVAFIVISSFFQASQNSMIASMVSGDPHIRIQAREREIVKDDVERILFPDMQYVNWKRTPSGSRASAAIENPHGWIEKLKKDPNVIATTPVYSATALVSYNKTTYSISVTGMRPSEQVKVTNIEDNMIAGSLLDLNKGTGRIVIGKELAAILAKQVGDTITMTSTAGTQTPFKIVGIFSTGNKFSDRGNAYALLEDAQKLGRAAGKVSQISVKVKNFREAASMADHWKTTAFDKVQSWDQLNENLMSMFTTQDITRYTVTGVILMVAGFGIYNILNMVVMQKRKDIAILRSMGYEQRDITTLFLFQGIALGITGGLLGCLVGYLISVGVGDISMGGPRSMTFRLEFDIETYFKALLISNGVALAASFFPARSASKMSPIEIIRAGAE